MFIPNLVRIQLTYQLPKDGLSINLIHINCQNYYQRIPKGGYVLCYYKILQFTKAFKSYKTLSLHYRIYHKKKKQTYSNCGLPQFKSSSLLIVAPINFYLFS